MAGSRLTTVDGTAHYVRETPVELDQMWRQEGDWLLLTDSDTEEAIAIQRTHIVTMEAH